MQTSLNALLKAQCPSLPSKRPCAASQLSVSRGRRSLVCRAAIETQKAEGSRISALTCIFWTQHHAQAFLTSCNAM